MADETETGVTPTDSARRRVIGPPARDQEAQQLADQIAASVGASATRLDGPPPPEDDEPEAEFVTEPDRLHASQEINLRKELFKMAKAQGLKPEQLNEMVTLRRSTYFTATIREHYRARDIGYAEGMRDGLRARWPAPAWCAIGIAIPFLVKFAVKLAYFGWAVYTAGG